MTNVDKALLVAEWSAYDGYGCPLCGACEIDAGFDVERGPRKHEVGCAMDLALSERGYCTQEERDRAREFIRHGEVATAPTLPPAPNARPTTHVLFEGQPLCGFMAGKLPKDWPPGHSWVSITDAAERPILGLCVPCDGCFSLAASTTIIGSRT